MPRRSFRRGRKRSVAWIPGFSTADTSAPSSSRLMSFAVVAAGFPNTWGSAIQLTVDSDLSMHGGEDAVMTRIRGRLFFSDGRVNAGAGLAANSFQLQALVVQAQVTPSGAGGTAAMPTDYTTSSGLGADNILWSDTVIVPSTTTSGVGTNLDNIGWEGRMLEVDVRAKRKVQSDAHILLWFQMVLAAGSTGADMRVRGNLRMLMMRSR